MKLNQSLPLFLLLFAALAHAGSPDPVLFDERVRLAKAAESDEQLKTYPHAMFKRAGRHFARTMRKCIALSPKAEMQAFMLVADINARGRAEAIEVKPDNGFARCFATRFAAASYLKPPAYPGRESFPVTMRVAP